MYSKFTSQLLNTPASFDFVAAHFACEKDKYSKENPNGYVNLGSAQNFLSKEDIAKRLDSLNWELDDTPYCQFTGTDDCRGAIAGYLQEVSGRNIDPANLVVGNGLISVLEALGIAILDAGESVLVPTPVFPGLVTALTSRTAANFVCLETGPENEFRLTPEMLKEKLLQQSEAGQPIKAVLLCSPGNPIGQVFDGEEIRKFVYVAEEFNVALIVDEIYTSSVFDGVEFVSALSMVSDNVFVIGGLSKDFGLAGYTTAWVHTTNEYILPALKKQSHFYRLSAPIQRAIGSFLDSEWRRMFSRRNQLRLTQSYQRTFDELIEMGISVTPAQSGLVLWLDLRDFLKSQDEAGQLELYRYLLEEHRVHLSPSSGFHFTQPGFYRICFSHEHATIQEGLKRIQQGLHQFQLNSTNHFAEV